MPNIGPMELAIVLIIALVIVGPKKLPELGKSAGKGFREFKDSVTGSTTTRTRRRRSPRPRPMPRRGSTARSSRAAPSEVARLRAKKAEPADELSVVEHLDELRTRIIVSATVLAVAVGLCFWQNDLLLAVANGPLPDGREPITFGVTEPFFTTMKLSFYAGILLAMPVLLYQAYAYILPAFKPSERRVVLPLLIMVPALFIAGAVFAYLSIMPAALNFLLSFNADEFNIQIRGSEYYGFFVLTLISVGILFQIPVGTIAVTRLAIVTPEQLGANRRYALLVIAVAGDAAARHRPGDDADLDGAALRPVRVLARPRAQVRASTRHNRRMVGRLLRLAASARRRRPGRRRRGERLGALRRRQPRGRYLAVSA